MGGRSLVGRQSVLSILILHTPLRYVNKNVSREEYCIKYSGGGKRTYFPAPPVSSHKSDGYQEGEADTIPTDSVPTDAIPTIRSYDDPVSLAPLGICRNSRNWEKIGRGRGVAYIESTALIEAPRQFEPHAYWVFLFKLSYQNFEMPDPVWGSNSPLIFGIWFDVFPIGTVCRPIHSTEVS